MQAVGQAEAVVGDAPSTPLETPRNGLPPKETFLSVFHLVWYRSECGGGAEGSSITVVFSSHLHVACQELKLHLQQMV